MIPAVRFLHGGADLAADIDNNGAVNGADLAMLLGAWGGTGGAADLNRDGRVDGGDLAILLNAWTG